MSKNKQQQQVLFLCDPECFQQYSNMKKSTSFHKMNFMDLSVCRGNGH